MLRVILKFGARVIKEVPLDKPVVTIGRSSGNDIHIDSLAVSNSHARIVQEGERFFIEDLGSLNGTFLDGKKVEREELRNESMVLVGKHTLSFAEQQEKVERVPDPSMFEQTMILDTAKHREMSGKVSPALPSPAGGKVGMLSVVQGKTDQREYEIRDLFATIGKGESADIKIKGFFVPEIAAFLRRTEEGYFVSPPGKGKKPKINGKTVEERTLLREGDVLEVGGVRMFFFVREVYGEDKPEPEPELEEGG